MAYKTIVVSLDNPDRAKVLLDAATVLCDRLQAHLIGLYVIPAPEVYSVGDFPVPPILLIDHEAFYRERIDTLEKMFESVTVSQNYPSEWRSVQSNLQSVANTISSIANTADLLLVSPSDRTDDSNDHNNTAELVLLSTSRPVLFVPDESMFTGLGKNCLVAFDGSKEAAKAVFDALPLLQLAESVQIHQVNPDTSESHRLLGNAGQLLQTLSRHGVTAELSQSASRANGVATELMTVARERGADIVVMGAYGHSRLREKIFGGTTRSFLQELPVPVLMSC